MRSCCKKGAARVYGAQSEDKRSEALRVVQLCFFTDKRHGYQLWCAFRRKGEAWRIATKTVLLHVSEDGEDYNMTNNQKCEGIHEASALGRGQNRRR